MDRSAKLILEITVNGDTTAYAVRRIEPDQRVAVKAWRLVKSNGDGYDVALMADGLFSCTCGDGTFRGHKHDCKHVRALVAVGLLEA